MFPAPVIFLTLLTMEVVRRAELAQRVTTAANTAFSVGASAGAAAGTAAGIGLAKPGLATSVITLPFKIINAPFYYLLGGHASDKRLKVLELAASNMNEAQNRWYKTLEEKVLRFDGLEVRLSEDFIKALKIQFDGLATTSSGQGRIQLRNPCPPSLCTFGEFVDPFDERYTCIVLNDTGRKVVTVGLLIISCVCGTILIIFLFRRAVRYSLRAKRAILRLLADEHYRENNSHIERQYVLPAPNNDSSSSASTGDRRLYYTTPSPIPIIK